MRGVVLAGGTGSRLGSLTKVVNKHLLPVRGVPMVYHALHVLRHNGIRDITVVSSPDGVGQLAKLLGSGYTYRVQDRPGGTAQALLEAESKESVAVVLGDNVFWPAPVFPEFAVAHVFLAEVADPRAFGVAEFQGSQLMRIVEKPKNPSSNRVVTGLYLFESSIFARLRNCCGEYAMTDALNQLAEIGYLSYSEVPGFWGDAGTVQGIKECSECAFL